MNKTHTFVKRLNIFLPHFVGKQSVKKSADFMACSLSELRSSDLQEAKDKSPSNFNSPRAGFGHVPISISLTKNILLACLALYNTTTVSSATTCQHSQR